MEFYIIRNEKIVFSEPPFIAAPPTVVRFANPFIDAKIQATQNADGTDNQKYCEKLSTAIIENPGSPKSQSTDIDWWLGLVVHLPDPVSNHGGGADEPSNLKVDCFGGRGASSDDVKLLEVIDNVFNVRGGGGGNNVTMNVFLKDLGLVKNSEENLPTINWKAKGLGLEEIVSVNGQCKLLQCKTNQLLPIPGQRMLTAWKNGEEFSGILTVSLVLNDDALSLLDSVTLVPKERFGHLKDMLEKEICTDIEIVVGRGRNRKVIKCHRAILAVGSKVFEKMFESGMKEAKKNRIEIEDMGEAGVRAMLAYLYYKEIRGAYGNAEIAMEVLQAGEKYDIGGLKNTVRDYMMVKECSWFGVDMALTLYVFAKALCGEGEEEVVDEEDDEDGDVAMAVVRKKQDGGGRGGEDETEKWEALKVKCLKVLKWYNKKKPKTLGDSVKYQEIFKENMKLEMEISSGMLRLD